MTSRHRMLLFLLIVALGAEYVVTAKVPSTLGKNVPERLAVFKGFGVGLRVCCFSETGNRSNVRSMGPSRPSRVILHTAGKRKKSKSHSGNTSGFGGAAVASCPCGSGLGYMKCCGRLHKDNSVYQQASASEVVRARYSAFSKRDADFLIRSTHPEQKDYMEDKENWKRNILYVVKLPGLTSALPCCFLASELAHFRSSLAMLQSTSSSCHCVSDNHHHWEPTLNGSSNCYDDFELPKCDILSETYSEGDKPVATVRFCAQMIHAKSREETSFVETSTFERASSGDVEGAWLYKDGILDTEQKSSRSKEAKVNFT